MTTDNKAAQKVSLPISLKVHRSNRAKKILDYASKCVDESEKIDKAFLKELGEIA